MNKKEAVDKHRLLWKTVAENIKEKGLEYYRNEYNEENDDYFIMDIKEDALYKIGETKPIDCNCYCCEYDGNNLCDRCPIVWNPLIDEFNNNDLNCELGEFGKFKESCFINDNEEAVKWALIISELPESEDE